ncbi:MAG TPA: hypothetical protein VG013_29635 [Gemmataceae bacterium]|jgi:hypothetical protein|nr:hypothetical protein [Gemmataceae bacterium]
MTAPGDGSCRYAVHRATAITEVIRRVHRQASRLGRGQRVTHAFRHIVRRLEREPLRFGEPAYRLPGLPLQVPTSGTTALERLQQAMILFGRFEKI